jgi:hypothetical protein
MAFSLGRKAVEHWSTYMPFQSPAKACHKLQHLTARALHHFCFYSGKTLEFSSKRGQPHLFSTAASPSRAKCKPCPNVALATSAMTRLCGTDQRPKIYANPFLFPPTPARRGYPPAKLSPSGISPYFSCGIHAGTPVTNYTTLAFHPQNSLPYYPLTRQISSPCYR